MLAIARGTFVAAMRCGVAAASLLLVFAALPLEASKHALTPAQVGFLQKSEKRGFRATPGAGAMTASQAVTDIALVLRPARRH